MSPRYTDVAIRNADQLVFGRAIHPVTCGFDLTIGAGTVFPEVNFTLPPLSIEESTWRTVIEHYHEIAEAVVRRARALKVPGIMLEFELLPPMTERPEWGAEVTRLLHGHLAEANAAWGLRSALRVTPTDLRDKDHPPLLRSGAAWEAVCRSFEACADAGAHVLSIESVGGKEVHDQALLFGDVRGLVFALGVLGTRDMEYLWDAIVKVCRARPGVLPGGDTACGFGNTAMQLAH